MSSIFDFSVEAGAQLSLQEKVGQLFMPAAFINDSEEEIAKLEAIISDGGIGGICFFHSRASAATNYEGKKEIPYNEDSFTTLKSLIERYQKAAKIPLIIAIDAEWGLAMRIENTPCYPYALTMGAMLDEPGLVYEVGRKIGADCHAAGIHWNFAPVADVNNNPDNPVIGYRSFGSNKKQVSEYTIAFTKGMQSEGVLSSAKHFPGHGDTATDSHLGIPLIDKSRSELDSNELYPFKRLIAEGVDSVMIGHLAVPELSGDPSAPATLSQRLIKGVLRKDLGFDGVVVSDALNMHAVSKAFKNKGELEYRAFEAGIDLFCFSENPLEGINMICEKANIEAIEESFRRIWSLKRRSIRPKEANDLPLSDPYPVNFEIAKRSLTQLGPQAQLFSDQENPVIGIQIGSPDNALLLKRLKEKRNLREANVDLRNPLVSRELITPEDTLMLAVYPPSVKPGGNFGFSDRVILLINDLLKHEKVVVCLFGNPYFLNLLDIKAHHTTLVAYQQFDEFQSVVVDYLEGKCEAPGKLPVQLKW